MEACFSKPPGGRKVLGDLGVSVARVLSQKQHHHSMSLELRE
jgi:hypothetical protein